MDYAEVEGSELGEYWEHLSNISKYYYCMSDEFLESVEKEIDDHLKNLEENYEIVEKETTRTRTYIERCLEEK